MYEQIVVFTIIILTLGLFVWGKLRYDFVALLAVFLLVIFNVINAENALEGFAHPAVMTVVSVLIISNALIKVGVIDRLVVVLNKGSNKTSIIILGLMSITALLSAFMNNIGALAMVVPITLKIAKEKDIPPSKLLMPVAFSSLLGGMLTKIGTPPNLIISSYRFDNIGRQFGFLAFTPVGITLTVIGILFTSFIGWKFIPVRDSESLKEKFNIDDYLFELTVTEKCPKEGIKLKDFYNTYNVNINVVSITRDKRHIASPGGHDVILPNDILIVRAMPEELNNLILKTCLELKGANKEKLISEKLLRSEDITLVEVVLRNDSNLIGRTAVETQLRNRYNANLIAVSRKGVYTVDRLKKFKFNAGDVLLLQAPRSNLKEMYSKMRCLPLTEEKVDLKINDFKFQQIFTMLIFATSIMLAIFNVLPVHISFAATALLLVIFNVVTPREFYDSIEWPTIIMIGSLFALGFALESSGGSKTIASGIVSLSNHFPPFIIVGTVMLITIILTNIINNNAATILMAPIAVSVAISMNVSIDPFLMAVVVGASTSFLTPIAHQSNTLVMGPGGYKFTDYWRLGLPLTLIALLIGIPLILYVWPF